MTTDDLKADALPLDYGSELAPHNDTFCLCLTHHEGACPPWPAEEVAACKHCRKRMRTIWPAGGPSLCINCPRTNQPRPDSYRFNPAPAPA